MTIVAINKTFPVINSCKAFIDYCYTEGMKHKEKKRTHGTCFILDKQALMKCKVSNENTDVATMVTKLWFLCEK